MPGTARRLRMDGATLVGLGFVYLGLPLLMAVVGEVSRGELAPAAALALCLVGALATGVGLCARERWAWALATCLAALAAGLGLAVALPAAAALYSQSRALSWQPVFLNLTRDQTQGLITGAGVAVLPGLVALPVLWRSQPEYDVPHRRAYTTLARDGALPAVVLLLAVGYLAAHFWPEGR